jgi:nuclear GTP-binding protein
LDAVAKMVLNDFLRGRIPWYVAPPKREDDGADETKIEGREGRLGEMAGKILKRKRDAGDGETVPEKEDATAEEEDDEDEDSDDDDEHENEFGGFEDGGVAVDPDSIGEFAGFSDNEDGDSEDTKTLVYEEGDGERSDNDEDELAEDDPPKKKRKI